MTIALDVNPLVFATQEDSPFRAVAHAVLTDLREQGETTYLFWPVAVGYVRVSTSPRLHRAPLSLGEAVENVESWVTLPNVQTGIERPGFWTRFAEACTEASATGNLVSDAYIVALMRQHGVHRVLTHDRDFRKFDGIRVVDPFV